MLLKSDSAPNTSTTPQGGLLRFDIGEFATATRVAESHQAEDPFSSLLAESAACGPYSQAFLSAWGKAQLQDSDSWAEGLSTQRALSILPQLSSPGRLESDQDSMATFVARGAYSFPVPLLCALRDLHEAVDEAHEQEFPRPSDEALKNADRLLREMYAITPRRFEVYPTPDGEIAIDAPGGHGCSVLLLCDSAGGALCLVNMNGKHRRARYSDSTPGMLPDGFVREALLELERTSESTP